MRRIRVSIRTGVLLAAAVATAVVSGRTHAQDMRFKRLTVDEGLSNNNVLALTQDRQGFIWIGTNDGLNRYDGYDFTTFRHDARDSTTLSNNGVSALLLDYQGRLWVGATEGVNLFDPDTGSFTAYTLRGEAGESVSRRITALFEDRSHRIWVGTTRGLYLFDPNRHEFTRYGYEATSASDFRGDLYRLNYVTAIYEDRIGRIWIGTSGGLNLLDSARGIFSRFETSAGAMVEDEVRDMAEDSDGNLWVATVRDGLYRLDAAALQFTRYARVAGDPSSLPSNSVRALQWFRGRLVVGTSEGLAVFNQARETFTTFTTVYGDETSLSFPSVRCILEDDQGNLWIGTWEGLNYFDRYSSHFVHVRRNPEDPRGLSDNLISSFAEDASGGVWVGTERGGLNYVSPDRRSTRTYRHESGATSTPSVDNVKALLVDSRGTLWLGTHDGGLNRYDRRTGRFDYFRHDPSDSTSLSGDRVYAIYEDRLGDLWIGTNKTGLNRFDRETGRFIRYTVNSGPGSISSNEVNAIHEDRLGNLWVGTAQGLNLMDRRSGTFTHFLPRRDDTASLIDPTIRTIFEDSRGRLWVGTSGGLELFDRRHESFTHYTVRDGLPNDAINCILEDADNNLWVSTNQGLSRFDPQSRTFRNFDVRDGVQSSQFNMNACMAASDGQLYFGGVNGFSRFHPASIAVNPLEPPVYITGFNLFNQPITASMAGSPLARDISETEEITLRHDQNVLSFEYVALNYAVSARNQYAYILEGFDEEWNYVGTRRSATYTNLPPGRYTFRVKASNNDGLWNEQGAMLKIHVLPPMWRTWWAYLSYVLILGATGYGAYRYSLNVLRLKNRLALEQIRRKTDDDLHAAKMQFFTNISHEFRTPLTLIVGPLQELLDAHDVDSKSRENLSFIKRNADRLLRLVNQLMDFRKLETNHMRLEVARTNIVAFIREIALNFDEFARHAGIRFSVRTDYDGVYVWFDRDKLETVFVNLLSNAFKFTPDGGEISVEIRLSGPTPHAHEGERSSDVGRVHVTVRDTGVGMSKDDLDHIFERFYQARPRVRNGTGIGVTLARGIVEIHGGTMTVESRKGQGTSFTVTLPLGREHLADAEVASSSHVPERPAIPVELEEAESTGDGSSSEPVGPADMPLVLLIDDHDDMRAYVRNCLLAENYRVREAANGLEGFRTAVEVFPDLVVCDVMMPEMDGIELCRKLKEDLRTSHIPVIMLTARSGSNDEIEGLETGADDYITKPFESRLLLARVHNLIDQRRKLRERFSLGVPIKPVGDARDTRDDAFLRKVLDILEEQHGDSDLTVEALSQEVGMSRVYLHKKLKALTDHTPSELIRTVRLKHASRLLLEGELTVSEIGYRVGFNSPSHFATSFKRQFGQSPTDYVASFATRGEDPQAE